MCTHSDCLDLDWSHNVAYLQQAWSCYLYHAQVDVWFRGYLKRKNSWPDLCKAEQAWFPSIHWRWVSGLWPRLLCNSHSFQHIKHGYVRPMCSPTVGFTIGRVNTWLSEQEREYSSCKIIGVVVGIGIECTATTQVVGIGMPQANLTSSARHLTARA